MKATFVYTSLFLVQVFCQTDIRFYKEFQFQGHPSLDKMREPNKCIQVPYPPHVHVKSVYSEFCVLLYPTTDCSGRWIKQLRGYDGVSLEKPSTPEDPNNFYQFRSWFPCNKSFDGGPIDVLIDGSPFVGRVGYSNVCECQSFRTTINGTYKFIKAEGNCLKVFSEENCQGYSQEIPYLYNKPFPLRVNTSASVQRSELKIALSFSPCKIPRSCSFINGTIVQVDLLPNLKNQTSSVVEQQQIHVYMKNTSELIEFFGTTTFVDTTISRTPTGMVGIWRKNSLDGNVVMTRNTGIPTFDEENWRKRFLKHLLRDFGHAPAFFNFTLNRNMSFMSTKLALKHGHYVANANIVIQKQFSVPYIVHMKVKGNWGSDQVMSEHELVAKMPDDVKYINSSTDYEIYVQIQGYLFANFACATLYNISEVV